MERSSGLESLFSQKLDRAVFATYFLGAVVPLAALAGVAHYFAFPAMLGDAYGTGGLIGLIGGVGTLSLAGYLALRRLTLSAIARMESDNRRLSALLDISTELSRARHGDEVMQAAVRCALALSSARAVLAVVRAGPDKPLELQRWAGDQVEASYETHRQSIDDLVEAALADSRPAQLVAGESAAGAGVSAIAFPLAAGGPAGALVVVHRGAEMRLGPADTAALATLAALVSVALENAELQDAQRNFFAHVTELIVAALDAHVEGRRGHAGRVARLSNRLAREMGLDEARLRTLHFAALLHDVGMLKIPPGSQRDPVHYQKHARIGYRMLSQIRLWRPAAPIVLHHHERFDGTGYPEGLSGEQIPVECRIIAVVDAFDAMSQDDATRPRFSPEAAIQELRDHAGSQFDPDVVHHFVRLAERGEIDS